MKRLDVLAALVVASSASLVRCGAPAQTSQPLTSQPAPASDQAGLLAGATNYVGPYPVAGDVTYPDPLTTRPMTVTAFPGQVQVFFDTTQGTSADFESLLAVQGATILGHLPAIGYYLVGVPVGTEGAQISSLSLDVRVLLAVPNVALELSDAVLVNDAYVVGSMPVSLNLNGSVIDLGDNGNHALTVEQCAVAAGSAFTDSFDLGKLQTKDAAGRTMVAHDKIVLLLTGVAESSHGKTLYVNMSHGGGLVNKNGWYDVPAADAQQADAGQVSAGALTQKALDAWQTDVTQKLMAIQALPPAMRTNLVVAMSTGNNNLDVEPALQRMRLGSPCAWGVLSCDPSQTLVGQVLTNDVVLCGTKLTLPGGPSTNFPMAAFSNHVAGGDPDVVFNDGTFANQPCAAIGTSFASPQCLADVIQVASQSGVTGPQALLAVKRAAAANGGVVDLSQAVTAARTPPYQADYSCQVTSVGSCTFAFATTPPDPDDSTPPTIDDVNPNPVTGTVTNLTDCGASATAAAGRACTQGASISPDGNDFWSCAVTYEPPIITNCHQ